MTINFDDLRHRPILDISTATTIGRVEHLVIDPSDSSVQALTIGKAQDNATVLPWSGINAIGPDAVTVDTTGQLRAPESELEQRATSGDVDPIGKMVLSDDGDHHGTLRDLVIDTDSGSITELLVGDRTLPGRALMGVGDYAAIVDQAQLGD